MRTALTILTACLLVAILVVLADASGSAKPQLSNGGSPFPFGVTVVRPSSDVGYTPDPVMHVGSSPTRLGTPSSSPSPSETPHPAPPSAKPSIGPVGRIVPAVVTSKGWATYQPGTGFWGSPGAILRGWGVSKVSVCSLNSAGRIGRCIKASFNGWCACGFRRGLPTLIDLSESAWIALCGAPSAGICRVEVSR